MDKLPEEGFTPRLADSYWAKGAAVMVCQDVPTKDWLTSNVPTLEAWGGSRLKVVGLDALPTFTRVAAWFLGPVEDMEHCFSWLRRLNRGWTPGNGGSTSAGKNPMGFALCSESTQTRSPCWRDYVGGPSAVWDRLLSPFWALSWRGGSKTSEGGGQISYGKYHFFYSG